MSRMNVTPAGIDWHRLTEDQVAEVGARIVEKATACAAGTMSGHRHFTDQAGREVCPDLALFALHQEAAAGTFDLVLPKARRIA